MDYSISIGIEKYVNLCSTIYAENDAKEFNKIAKEVLSMELVFITIQDCLAMILWRMFELTFRLGMIYTK